MDADVALRDEHKPRYPPVFRNGSIVSENIRRHDLRHVHLIGVFIEEIIDELDIFQNLAIATIPIQHQVNPKPELRLAHAHGSHLPKKRRPLEASHDSHRFSNRPNPGDGTAETIGNGGLTTLQAADFSVDSLPSQGAEFPVDSFHTKACEGLQTKAIHPGTLHPADGPEPEAPVPKAGQNDKIPKILRRLDKHVQHAAEVCPI
jgi:hypothetical protein